MIAEIIGIIFLVQLFLLAVFAVWMNIFDKDKKHGN